MDLEFIAIDLQPLSVNVFAARPFLQIDLFWFVSINRLVTEWAERRWEGQREEKGGGGIEKVQWPNIFMCHHTIFELKCLSHTITAYWQQCIFKYTHVYRWNDCGHGHNITSSESQRWWTHRSPVTKLLIRDGGVLKNQPLSLSREVCA